MNHFSDLPTDIAAAGSPEHTNLAVLRGFRLILRLIFGAVAIFMLTDVLFVGSRGPFALRLQAIQLAWSALGLALASTAFGERHAKALAVIGIIGCYTLVATVSGISNDRLTPVILFVATTIGTASVLPWGVAAQAWTVVAAEVLMVFHAHYTAGGLTNAHAYTTLLTFNLALAASIAIASHVEVAQATALELDRQRRKAEADRSKAEEELRQANESLEARVSARTAELSATNRALESFSYSVSHDLRGPLRLISADAWELEQAFSEVLGEKGLQQTNHITATAQRMDRIIQGLLDVSRLTQIELHREQLDLSSLAATVAKQVAESYPDQEVALVIEPNLAASADAQLVETLLTNLFDNAWKYSAKTSVPEVSLYLHRADPPQVFALSDNGAGFDPSQADQIFRPFRRLHEDSEFGGTGIGLATVERIVKRHGGDITADAAVDEGACFYFSLEGGPDSSLARA